MNCDCVDKMYQVSKWNMERTAGINAENLLLPFSLERLIQ